MREDGPSRTAQHVAAHRLTFERMPAEFGDAAADDALARDVARGVRPRDDERMARYLRGRTAFFDRVVLNAIGRGTTQIVLVGAGYDGRALRYAAPDVRWFEVDHPPTQQDKRDRLARLGIDAADVTFAAVDLERDDVTAALLAAGFEPDAPALIAVEGVLVYLDAAVAGTVLAALRAVATAGTRLAVSAGIPGAAGRARAGFAARAADLGEPVRLGDTDIRALLEAARWRPVELSERATRAGFTVAAPAWTAVTPAASVPATVSRIGRYLERTYGRDALDELPPLLADEYGIDAHPVRKLDVGVLRAGPGHVARVFARDRPREATERDAEALRRLAAAGFPAERPVGHVGDLAGQAVLVTAVVPGRTPRPTTATYRALGDLLGRLHTLPGLPQHEGGAWHHLADGGAAAERDALLDLLDARAHVRPAMRDAHEALRAEVAALDDGAGLPREHPLGFLLWSAGLAGTRHVTAAYGAYRAHVILEADERAALGAAIGRRPLVFDGWTVATGRAALGDVAAGRAEVRARAERIAGQVLAR